MSLTRFRERDREWLIDDDILACIQRGGRKRHVSLVRAGNDNKIGVGAGGRFLGISDYLGVWQICMHFLRIARADDQRSPNLART